MIKIIAAVSKNGAIGRNNDLLFKDKEDLKMFKETTTGGIVIMGRKTWESIGSKPLPNRKNIVVTRTLDVDLLTSVAMQGGLVDYDLESLLQSSLFPEGANIYVIGGGEIYRQVIDHADELIISHFDEEVKGDVYFPTIDDKIWLLSKSKKYTNFTLKIYRRRKL